MKKILFNLTKTCAVFSSVIMLTMAMFLFAACQPEPEPPKKPEIPAELQDTTWVHKDGDSVSFTKDSVTVKLKAGGEQTFTIKDTSSFDESGIKQTILFFNKDDKTKDTITFRNGIITMVNLGGLNKTNDFTKNNSSGNNNITYEDVEQNGMKFVYSKKYNGYEITEYTGTEKNVTIPKVINSIPVTSIGINSFHDKKLTGVTIPDSVTQISNSAFNENKLTSVTIPNSVTNIGNYAFSNNQLTSVTIPNSVTNIGNYAFSNNQLTSVTIPNSVTNIGICAFMDNQLNNVTIPNSVTFIGNDAFYNNQLTSVVIPNSVTNIGYGAFRFNKLTSVFIPNSVTHIGDWAFSDNQLTSVTIPNSVTEIGVAAFMFNKLTNVTIPNSVTEIGGSAFSGNKLTHVTLGNSVTRIGGEAFMNDDYYTYEKQITRITIPNSVTFIGNDAFRCINNITIGANVTLEYDPREHNSAYESPFERFAYFYDNNGKSAGTYTSFGSLSNNYDTEWRKQ